MLSVKDALTETFITTRDRITRAYGEPDMQVPEFTKLRHRRRVTAVWFIDGKNHGIHIDIASLGGISLGLWHHGANVHNAEIHVTSPEAADRIFNLLVPEFFPDAKD